MTGHFKQRSPGSWTIWIDLGKDANGKRRQKTVTVRGGKREAQKELNRMLAELQAGAFVEPGKLTVGQYLQRWLKDYAQPNVAPKTLQRYEQIIEQHLTPALGGHPLTSLKPLHIQAYYTEALKNGRIDGKGGLSAQSVLHHHRLLFETLKQAVRWQMLQRNPAEAVEPPSPVKKELNVVDADGAARLLAATEGTWLHLCILLAVATGLRRGEILGLRWCDVDLTAGTLTVLQTISAVKGEIHFKAPKSKSGRRQLRVAALAVDALTKHRAAQAEQKLALGDAYHDLGLVIAPETGGYRHPDSVTTAFARLCRKLGIQMPFHALRHSHATQLLQQKVHPKVVSGRLGHSTIRLTMDTYSHLIGGMDQEAADLTDVALRVAVRERAAADRPAVLRIAN